MKEKEGQVLYPSCLPDRYKVMEIDKSMGGYMTSLWFQGDSEEDFILLDYKFDEQIHLNTDTEHTKIKQVLINKSDAVLLESKQAYEFIWVKDGVCRYITFKKKYLKYDEAIEVAESIEWVDENSIEVYESKS